MYKAAMLTFERKVVVGTGVLNQAFFLFFLGQSSPLQFIKHLGETIEGEYNGKFRTSWSARNIYNH
jgi:hypothetical protein